MPSRSFTTHPCCTRSRRRPIGPLQTQAAGFEAPAYLIEGPHRVVSTAGVHPWTLPPNMLKPIEQLTRSGLFGPWDAPDIDFDQEKAGINPARCDPWGLDSFQLWPNFVILVWGQNWYLTYHYWPTAVNEHVFEGTLYFVPPKNASERVAHELAAVTFKEYGLQDANTLEATQSMLESRVPSGSPSWTRKSCAGTCTRWPPSGATTTPRPTRRRGS